jgi:hypothetical protein
LTPEKREKVIDLAANMVLLNHIQKLVDEMRAEMASPDSSSSDNGKEP